MDGSQAYDVLLDRTESLIDFFKHRQSIEVSYANSLKKVRIPAQPLHSPFCRRGSELSLTIDDVAAAYEAIRRRKEMVRLDHARRKPAELENRDV